MPTDQQWAAMSDLRLIIRRGGGRSPLRIPVGKLRGRLRETVDPLEPAIADATSSGRSCSLGRCPYRPDIDRSPASPRSSDQDDDDVENAKQEARDARVEYACPDAQAGAGREEGSGQDDRADQDHQRVPRR